MHGIVLDLRRQLHVGNCLKEPIEGDLFQWRCHFVSILSWLVMSTCSCLEDRLVLCESSSIVKVVELRPTHKQRCHTKNCEICVLLEDNEVIIMTWMRKK